MTRIDRTPLFREILASSSSSSSSPPGAEGTGLKHRRAASPSGTKSPKRRRGAEEDERERKEREFLKEAYRIENHVRTLDVSLRSVRRAYLSTATQPPRRTLGADRDRARRRRGGPDEAAEDPEAEAEHLRALESAQFLTEREKDEIDLRAKIILKTCRERVGLLEAQEKALQAATPTTPTASSLLHTLLPSLAPAPSPSASPSALVAAHRAAVLMGLTAHLARTADAQYALQEERARRREERGKSLGGQSAVVQGMGSGKGKGLEGVQLTVPTVAVRASDIGNTDADASGEATDDLSLTPAQAQLFAEENAHLLESMQSTLSSVLSAESSILEIAQLQSSLLAQLHTQSESIDLLYDDAVRTVGDVERANKELRKAKERSGEARVFLLFFLIMGSLTLLFLDWYK